MLHLWQSHSGEPHLYDTRFRDLCLLAQTSRQRRANLPHARRETLR